MFARIMAVVLAVILLTTVLVTGVWWLTLRNRQIDARLDYLISEAEDIAYLAGNLSGDSLMDTIRDRDSATRTYLNRMADKVNREFGAYIAVMDRGGNVMTNSRVMDNEDPEFMESLNTEEINEAFQRILAGETIRLRSEGGNDPTFTVGVPFMMDDTVTGAVFIRTKAQRIEGGLAEILGRTALLAACVALVSGVAVFLFVRRRMKPLKQLETAAATIAEGDFSVQVDEKQGDPELRELSGAFNTMTRKLQGVETGRREFVANVSHELRSPITSIRGFAEGMADGVIPEGEQPKYLRLVADESKRLSGLIDDLLALSRLEWEDAKPEMTVFDVNEMLRRAVIRRMNDLEAKKIDVGCEFEEDSCMVKADSDRIEQVVINLLDNAIKFTPEGGKISLESAVKDGIAEITVRDSGCGIAPEDREKVFDRFFTADRAHTAGKGTGLGLSICKRIMEMHGQGIRLLDTDEGAAFRFTLEMSNCPNL
ncbi:MAG: HAMP domain-containing protein [Clostridiales bacterium]|nr:HAMP domain-containing protein [Clostridiales bacterium]